MPELEEKLKALSNMYRKLQKVSNQKEQLVLLNDIDKLCKQTYSMLDVTYPTSDSTRKMKQVKDIQNKIQEFRIKKIKANESIDSSSISTVQGDQLQEKTKMNRKQLSKRVTRTIAFQQIRSTQLKISPQQIQKVAIKMQNNLQIMKQIECLVVEQGEDIDLIENHINQTYQQMKDTNKELDQACQIKNKTRLMKIRAGVSGILGTIGFGIFGIPGMVVGLFSGWRATK